MYNLRFGIGELDENFDIFFIKIKFNSKFFFLKKGLNHLCQNTNLTQKFKLLGEVSIYDLYYFLTYPLK